MAAVLLDWLLHTTTYTWITNTQERDLSVITILLWSLKQLFQFFSFLIAVAYITARKTDACYYAEVCYNITVYLKIRSNI